MSNILDAIYNIVSYNNFNIVDIYKGRNRINNVGVALENYIKDSFSNTFDENSESVKLKKYNKVFSWSGNQNNPPDIIIRNGDAIEVKKIQGKNSSIALNSSYPKSTIRSDSNLITDGCKNCEDWIEKDIIYCVGHTDDSELKSLWMVYGNIYAANHEIYQLIKETISEGIDTIPNVEFAATKELGRVNNVDPLGITYLRIRGMWHIQNPRRVYNYLEFDFNNYRIVSIIPISKYESFPDLSIKRIEEISNTNFSIIDVEVKDPNNPVKLIPCKLITLL